MARYYAGKAILRLKLPPPRFENPFATALHFLYANLKRL